MTVVRPSRLPPHGHSKTRPAVPRKHGSGAAGASKRIEATFGFIDMAGFTALTEAHGDFDAADLATRFAQLTREALGEGDRLIKTIGDAVLVTSPTPEGAIDLIDRLLELAAKDATLPALRAGFHHGPAVQRDGDVYGAAVNLAARVAAEAYAGEVLATAALAAVAGERGLPVIEIGAVPLKNVKDTTVLWSLGFMVGAMESAIDPVCQAVVDRRTGAGCLRHERKMYWFCSLTCAAAFASNPQWHVARATTQRPPL
jgi:class 3 adenylate cyclase/YHS domain-containing protein